MKIFLAGATGFTGGHVLEELCRRGHSVTCLVRRAKRGGGAWPEQARRLIVLGGHGPITSEEYGMLLRENLSDLQQFMKRFGFEPRPFSVGMWERIVFGA